MIVNDLGKLLVEDCQKFLIVDFIRQYKKQLKDLIVRSRLELLDANINLATTKTGGKGVRFWFQCPLCKERAGILYIHPLTNVFGCRKCLNLEYKKRRYKGMLEGEI